MNDTHRVTFRDGRQVSALGQGTWKMGRVPSRRNEEIRALREGIDLGLDVVDTAEMYGNEDLVGEALLGRRDKVFLIGKVLPENADRRRMKLACEQSLRQLKTDRMDLYLLHWRGPHPFEETVAAMLELQREGKIERWGVSNMDVEEMEHFYAISGGNTCDADEVVYNPAQRGVEFDLIPWCRANGVPLIAYSPIDEGRLVGNGTLAGLARRLGATPAQIALAWVVRFPGVIAIPKAGSAAHVRENAQSLSLRLTEADWRELDLAFPPPLRKMPLAGY